MSPRSREDQEEVSNKRPRTSRACIQCRNRKQRCEGPSNTNLPCRRCSQLGATCSFTTTPEEAEVESISITNHKVGRLQLQLRDHNKRIGELEQIIRELKTDRISKPGAPHLTTSGVDAIKNGDVTAKSQSPTIPVRSTSAINPRSNGSYSMSPLPISPPRTDASFNMDAVNLDAPMKTLRNIQTMSNEGHGATRSTDSMTYDPILPLLSWKEYQSFGQDPVAHGILTNEESQQLFDIFFTHCHPHAPFLCVHSQRSAAFVRQTSPALFLSVCTVALRFWQVEDSGSNYQGLHECYPKLVALLDTSISRLLLQPYLSDVKLDHIRCLLLYIQWMPVEQRKPGMCHTRYNDVSAWSVLGLAIRYSIFLGLDRTAVLPFTSAHTEEPNADDFARLRVWINLMTCDTHLMLSAGLPASLDPEPVSKIVRKFASHKNAVQPDDSRVAANCDLVVIARKVTSSSGDPFARTLGSAHLREANSALDEWERSWRPILNNSKPNTMPWTSARWYRLALNSTCLAPVLSPSKVPESLELSTLQALENSIIAATETLYASCEQSTWSAWPPTSLSSLPPEPFTISDDALGRFRYAVDSAWITHSFAAVFLVLCYTRGAINDELQITHLLPNVSSTNLYPTPPRNSSLFYRIISLASQIFDAVSRTSDAHPAADYHTIINNVFSAILKDQSPDDPQLQDGEGVDELFELMFSSGFNWQSALFVDNTDGANI